MFKIFSKKGKKRIIDSFILKRMKEYSNETEKVFQSFIGFSIEDFPRENIKLTNYGIYKARLGTNLMVAIAASIPKRKRGFGSKEELFDDMQIATSIAYLPFKNEEGINYLSRDLISDPTAEIIKCFISTFKNYHNRVHSTLFNPSDIYFDKIKTYFQDCVSECVENRETMKKIIDFDPIFFDNLAIQNLKIMAMIIKI